MAKIIVARNQQLAMAAEHPKPYYSRVVSVGIIAAGGGAASFASTPILGSRIWLLNIKVIMSKKAIDGSQATYLIFRALKSKPQNFSDVAAGVNLLPLWVGDKLQGWWQFADGNQDPEWKMMRFFEQEERRFAVGAMRVGEDSNLIQVSFEISEG